MIHPSFTKTFMYPNAGTEPYTPENKHGTQKVLVCRCFSFSKGVFSSSMFVLGGCISFLGWVFPYISRIHTAYIGEDSSILGTWSGW